MPGLAKHSNGLPPHDVARRREKCPDHPTKRTFHTMREAEDAASQSSKQYRKTIVPYACAGCGFFHVTGKLDGSDVLTANRAGGVQTAAMQQREALRLVEPPTERRDMSEVIALASPIVPANRAAREKMLRAYLDGRDTVTTAELTELLSVSDTTVRTLMTDTDWTRPDRGGRPGSRHWSRAGYVEPPEKRTPKRASAKTPARRAARSVASTEKATTSPRSSTSWAAWHELPADMTIGQARQMLAALGMSGELRVWRA